VHLIDLISSSDVVIGLRAPDVASAAARLLEQTLPQHGFEPDEVRRLVAKVIAREREIPTVCGTTALPHARDGGINLFVAAVAINHDGVVQGQREPRVIIAFLSPESKRTEHLELLASLSRLSRDAAAIDAIAEAQTPQDVVALLQR
jgi:mannitol/fructose-specific phosphotransferase system IIA component (Ntr-type)